MRGRGWQEIRGGKKASYGGRGRVVREALDVHFCSLCQLSSRIARAAPPPPPSLLVPHPNNTCIPTQEMNDWFKELLALAVAPGVRRGGSPVPPIIDHTDLDVSGAVCGAVEAAGDGWASSHLCGRVRFCGECAALC